MHKPKRMDASSSAFTVGGQGNLLSHTFPESVNVHGLRMNLNFATETAGAVIDATWAIMCLPEHLIGSTPLITDILLSDESLQSFVWAFGKRIVITNQSTEVEFIPSTSRSCEHGSQIVLVTRYHVTFAGTSPTLRASANWTWWETQL